MLVHWDPAVSLVETPPPGEKPLHMVVDTIVAPSQNVHVLIPQTCEYAACHGKRVFADVTEVKDLETGKLS